jgi:two-component system, OmpR family, KDP operon response regulator KdpE
MIGRKPCILVTGAATPLHRRIRLSLRAEGYDVLKASSYSRAIAMTHGYRPDLVLLDMDLPGTMDGFDFCTMIRQSLQTPIIAISVKPDLQRKVRALDLGADDYLAEPWSMDELLARLRACLRRATAHHGPPFVEYGFIQHVHKGGVAERDQLYKNDKTWDPACCSRARGAKGADNNGLQVPQQNEMILYSYDHMLHMDVARQEVYVDSEPIYLPPKEFHLLYLLLLHAGKVLTHRFLLQQVWGEGYSQEKGYVRVCICQLRKKIAHDYILTQSSTGYLFRDKEEVAKHRVPERKRAIHREGELLYLPTIAYREAR